MFGGCFLHLANTISNPEHVATNRITCRINFLTYAVLGKNRKENDRELLISRTISMIAATCRIIRALTIRLFVKTFITQRTQKNGTAAHGESNDSP